MFARDVMSSPVVSVTTGTRVKEAAGLLASGGYTALPVVDERDAVLGIVTEADIVRGRFPRDPRARMTSPRGADAPTAGATVGEVMTTDVLSTTPATDVVDLVTVMLEHGVRSIPIVDAGRLVGIVTRRDLLAALARDDETIAAAVRQRLTAYGGSERWTVAVTDGTVSIQDTHNDPTDRHVAEVLAQSVPGVVAAHAQTADR
jgi:CBS-domain-containing membrane protein